METIIELIPSLGFPIVAYLLLYFDLRKVILERIDKLEAKMEKCVNYATSKSD